MFYPNPYFDIPYLPDDDPLDLPALAGLPTGPLELEIGFGRGHFLLDRARAVPGNHIIGLETKRKGVFIAKERADKHGLANIHPYHGDALRALPKMTPDGSVARVFIHFPDPWWKVRHEKRMVVCPDLIGHAARLLADGGELFVQTDVDYRAEYYLKVLTDVEDLIPAANGPFVDENPFGARSLREKKCIETGLAVFRMLFKRKNR